MKRMTMTLKRQLIAQTFALTATVFGLTAFADYTLTSNETWTAADVAERMTSVIDLHGYTLTVPELTGDATITDTTGLEYELLDSIKATGAQRIFTGVTIENNAELEMDFGQIPAGKTANKSFFALNYVSGLGAFNFCVQESSGTPYFRFYGGGGSIMKCNTGDDYTFKVRASVGNSTTGTGGSLVLTEFTNGTPGEPKYAAGWTEGGNPVGPTYINGTKVTNRELILFDGNETGKPRQSSCTFYRLWFKEGADDTKKHTFVPVRQVSTGAVGILDLEAYQADPTTGFHGNAGTGADFTPGNVTNYLFGASTPGTPGELHVNVASGTATNSTVTLSGTLKFVKDGAGAFVTSKAGQAYVGGTEVAAGILNFPAGDTGATGCLGLAGSMVRVEEDATLDLNGNTGFKAYALVLAGGTLRNGTAKSKSADDHLGTVGRVTLEADSAENVLNNLTHTDLIDLNGHKLTVQIGGSGQYYILNENGSFTNGTVDITNGGWFRNEGGALDMRTVNMKIMAVDHLANDIRVNDLELLYRVDYGTGNGRFLIYGTYKAGNYHRNCELQDGATLDLGEQTSVWPVESTFSSSTPLTFAENATVTVKLGARTVDVEDCIVSWEQANKPGSTVTFRADRTEAAYAGRDLEVRDDGLYLVPRIAARATWTGNGDQQSVNDPGNWDCQDSDGNSISGHPSVVTVVTLPDGCTNDFPVGGAFLAREVVLPATIGANLDWSGITAPFSGALDLQGNTLTLSQLTGDATITDTTKNADYEQLDAITSDATQYLSTGVTIEDGVEFELDFGKFLDGTNKTVFALDILNRKSCFYFCVQNTTYFYIYGQGTQFTGAPWNAGHDYRVHVKAGNVGTGTNGTLTLTDLTDGKSASVENNEATKITVENPNTSQSERKVNDRTLNLFGANNETFHNRAKYTFYRLWIKDGDGHEHTFVPVRKLSTGEVGILDLEAYRADRTAGFHGNGRKSKTGSHDFTPGNVTGYICPFGESLLSGELHVNVASGTAVNSAVTLSGALKLVKEGSGTFVAQKKAQTYVGGTEVLGGTFKLYNNTATSYTATDRVLGALGSAVEIGPQGTVEISSTPGLHNYNFVLSGGKLSNNNTAETSNFSDSSENGLGAVTLTADSSAVASRQLVFANGVLDLGGHTLTLNFANTSKTVYFHGNGQTVTNGTVAINGGTVTTVFYDVMFEDGDLDMRTASLDMVSAYLVLKSNLSVSNYIARAAYRSSTLDNNRSAYKLSNPGDMSVYGAFQPWNDFFYGCTLQDGATLDLSKQTGLWSVTSTGANPKKTVTFVENATVTVKLGGRKPKCGPIVTWADADEKPDESVNFVLDPAVDARLVRKADGLWLQTGFLIRIR